MIITRSPLRISLGDGGTDLPSYYREHSGFLIAAAIDKYVYITLHQTFVPELIIKYFKLERVLTVDEVEHPIIREALRLVGIEAPSLEITSMADIPAGTGSGSSGSLPRRCSRLFTRTRKISFTPPSWPSKLVRSSWRNWASRSENRIINADIWLAWFPV